MVTFSLTFFTFKCTKSYNVLLRRSSNYMTHHSQRGCDRELLLQAMLTLYKIPALASARKPYRWYQIGLPFTHKNEVISVRLLLQRRKMRRADLENGAFHIGSVPHWCSVNGYPNSSGSELVGARAATHWEGSRYSRVKTGIKFTATLSANRSSRSLRFNVCERLVPVLCHCCSYYTG